MIVYCLLCDSSTCCHATARGWATIESCEACQHAPVRGVCKLCAEHGCRMGCGDAMLSDGPYCGGDDGELCNVYGRVMEA